MDDFVSKERFDEAYKKVKTAFVEVGLNNEERIFLVAILFKELVIEDHLKREMVAVKEKMNENSGMMGAMTGLINKVFGGQIEDGR